MGEAGGFFAKVNYGGIAVGGADDHETPAADIAGLGVDNGEGIGDGDGGIDGVTAGA